MFEWSVLIVAAFAAGILNSIAGGGSFLTFPALVFAGIPPVTANATNAVAVFPGYLGAAFGFRDDIVKFERWRLYRYGITAIVGGLIGSLLLLVTSNDFFSILIPWLLLFATALFAFGGKLATCLKSRSDKAHVPDIAILLAVSIYGGYFNGGLGIILLAAFVTIGLQNLNLMNGLKSGLSFMLTAVSVTTFAIAGIVAWPQAIVMMIASTIGGYVGAGIAKILPTKIVRGIVIMVGLTMSAIFFY